jgi:hypothetical protein
MELMTKTTEGERMAHVHALGTDGLLWRASLGQAAFELLVANVAVTTPALIAHLETNVRPDDLVHKAASTAAAIRVLRELQRWHDAPIEP